MNLTDKRKWVNVVLWLLSVASMIGLMILAGRKLDYRTILEEW